MKRPLLASFLLAASLTATAKSPCDSMVPYGYPRPQFKAQILCRTSYLQLHNNDAKTGGIAFELLTPSTIGSGNEPRTDNFRSDVEVPRDSRSSPKEYEGTGFDKGHLAPAGDMREDGKSMSQSFFMSNMAPQYPNHNRGVWRGLELLVRNWVVAGGRNLYVITGTVYQHDPNCLPSLKDPDRRPGPCTVGDGRVWIPEAFYKVVVDKDKQDAVAYLIPNQPGGFKKLVDYRMTVGVLEKSVGVDLLPGADPTTKQKLSNADGATFPTRAALKAAREHR